MQLQNFYAQDVNGNIVPGATCSLFLPGTTILATGLVDLNGAAMTNPFQASFNGLAQFAAPNGLYDLRIESGLITNTLRVTFSDNLLALSRLQGFLAPSAIAPATRADGTPLQIGDRYVNTTSGLEYLYKPTGWQPNNLDGQLISDQTDPLHGAYQVGIRGPEVGETGNKLTDIVLQVFNPKRWGCVGDGISNDAPAFSRMLDAVAVNGGLISCKPGADYHFLDPVYWPQRYSAADVAGRGIVLEGNNCTFSGEYANVIFESGTGTKSTVALGGATNWGIGNELPTTIHTNSRILNCNFKHCKTPLKLFNWLQGCVIAGCYSTDFTDQGIWAKRCFYLAQRDTEWRPLRADRAALMPIMQYDEANNTQSFVNVHCSGIKPNGTWSGVGLSLDGGVQGLFLGAGAVSLEGCTIGLWLKSTIYSMGIMGVYFELCGTAIQSTGANLLHVVMDFNEFEDCPIDISVDNWVGGYYGSANKNEGSVTFGTGCVHEVHYPPQYLTQATHVNWVNKPAGWTVPAGCQVHRNDMIFNNGGDALSSVLARNEPSSSGGSGIAPKKYTGDCFNVAGLIPYCLYSTSAGTLTIDTKIAWNPSLAEVRFAIQVTHSQVDVVTGWVSCNNQIRLDVGNPVGITVAASNNSGFLRIVMAGFSVAGISSATGSVRIL